VFLPSGEMDVEQSEMARGHNRILLFSYSAIISSPSLFKLRPGFFRFFSKKLIIINRLRLILQVENGFVQLFEIWVKKLERHLS
jgi:hypothetical protein